MEEETIQVCDDCVLAIVNDDMTALDDARCLEVSLGVVNLASEGNVFVLDACDDFSRRPCRCCGTKLAGARHAALIRYHA